MGDNYKSYESFYTGGFSSFKPSYGENFTGMNMNASTLSSTTSPQTANQLKEVLARIKEGVRNVELQPLGEGVLDTIPKQQFTEIKALMKLSGVSPSMHAPIVDPSGFGQQGFTDEDRAEAERKLFSAVEKASELGEGVKVVIHSSNGGYGKQYRPGEGEDRFHLNRLPLVDQETGQIVAAPKEEEEISFFRPSTLEKPEIREAEEHIAAMNQSKWREKMTNLAQLQKMTNEVLEGANPLFYAEEIEKVKDHSQLSPQAREYEEKLRSADIFVRNTHLQFDNAFTAAYKYGTEEQKKELKKLADGFQNTMKNAKEEGDSSTVFRQALNSAIGELGRITESKGENPQVITSAEEYARKKASETFGNLAWNSFDKLGKRDANKAPVIAIENLYHGMAYSKAEDLKGLVDESRSKFVKNAVKGGMNEKEAKKIAEKVIGVTWDVGHLNVLKKEGFTDTDIIKQTEKIAPYVKHVHLTDNFGYSDSHLAPGMGNVPFKEILKELEKTGRLDEMKKVIEAGGLVNPNMGLGMSPFKSTLGAFGAPMYSSGGYWNQAAAMATGGGYFGGQGYLPEKHFSMYGSGFSSLPTELGGQIPGTASRATGTPMA